MSEGEHNAPIVKEWFCRLLGINGNEEHTVGNVLPGHNLQLIEKKPDRPLADRLDALLIDERILEPEHVTAVTYEQLATDEEGKRKEYSQLRAELPIFNRNRISGDLFRHGISLGNYRIVEAKRVSICWWSTIRRKADGPILDVPITKEVEYAGEHPAEIFTGIEPGV